MELNKKSYSDKSIEKSNDIIDIKDFIKFLLRNKNILIASAFLGFSISFLIAITIKRTWKGEFQIVIAQKSDSKSTLGKAISGNIDLSNFLSLRGGSNESLNTEIEILKSPSVLMPVFEYAKGIKDQQGNKSIKWLFQNWEKNLEIINLDNTSIVNVSYFDKSKGDILPILKKISSEYKKYSQRDRELNFEQGLSYLKNQIDIYKEKGLKSRMKVQEYASEYDLGFSGITSDFDKDIFFLDIEKTKVRENEKIRLANLNLELIEEMSSYDEILSFSRIVSSEKLERLEIELEKLINETVRLESIYTENSPVLNRKKEEREILSKLLKNNLKNLLETAIKDSKSKIKSSMRPKNVIVKFKELIRESLRDELTLTNLENNQRLLQLDQSRIQNPWEVITEPTLRDIPVAPKRKLIAMQGLFLGILFGILYSIFFEKKKGFLYSEKSIQDILNLPKLDSFQLKDSEDLEIAIDLLNENIFKFNSYTEISFIPIGNINYENLEDVINKFKTISKDTNFLLNKNIKNALKSDYLILLIQKGVSKKQEIINIKKRLINISENSIGWIFIEE